MSIPTFDVIYLCSHSFEVFVPCQDKQNFKFDYKFPYIHYSYENNLLSVCLSCYLKVDSVVHDSTKWFIRYFIEKNDG